MQLQVPSQGSGKSPLTDGKIRDSSLHCSYSSDCKTCSLCKYSTVRITLESISYCVLRVDIRRLGSCSRTTTTEIARRPRPPHDLRSVVMFEATRSLLLIFATATHNVQTFLVLNFEMCGTVSVLSSTSALRTMARIPNFLPLRLSRMLFLAGTNRCKQKRDHWLSPSSQSGCERRPITSVPAHRTSLVL
jgi:hypothetical protein